MRWQANFVPAGNECGQEYADARGVEFTDEISDRGYGFAIHFKMPGNFEAELYQPLYKKQSEPRP
jgi:hypothetical protein